MTAAMATPGEKLAAELKRRGITPTQFGEMLRGKGLDSGYKLVRNWVLDRGFKAQNRILTAEMLGLPLGHFEDDAPQPAAALESRVEYDAAYPNFAEFAEAFGGAYDPEVITGLGAARKSIGDVAVDAWMRMAASAQAGRRGKAAAPPPPAPPPPGIAPDDPLVLRKGPLREQAVAWLEEQGVSVKETAEVAWWAEGFKVNGKLIKWPAGYGPGKRGELPVRVGAQRR